MTESERSTELQRTAQKVQLLVERLGGSGAIIGGIALGFHAEFRGTQDVDAVLSGYDVTPEMVAETARDLGIIPRVEDILHDAKTILVMRFVDAATKVRIDISLSYTAFEIEAIEHAVLLDGSYGNLKVVTADDLVIMKAVAHRLQDIADIQKIAEVCPRLDVERIEYWLRQFGEALEEPDLWDRIRGLLKRHDK